MREDRRRATWMGALLGALTAVLALALQARASDWQGGGGPSVHVSNVNGRIEIRHANDNRPLSPGKSRNHDRGDKDDEDDDMI
jgi:hypothetical protein